MITYIADDVKASDYQDLVSLTSICDWRPLSFHFDLSHGDKFPKSRVSNFEFQTIVRSVPQGAVKPTTEVSSFN